MIEPSSHPASPGRGAPAALAWPVLLFAGALALRIAVAAATRFDGLYGQDPYAYLACAQRLRQALATLSLPPPCFYPIGYPLLAALAMSVFGARALAGQAVSILAGSLAPVAGFGLVREIDPGSKIGALVAGGVLALAPQAVISSVSVGSDAAGLVLAAFAAWAMARYLLHLRLRDLTLAALLLGVAVLARWVYGLLALPWAAAAGLAWRERSVRPLRAAGAALLAVMIGGAVVGSQFAGKLGHGPLPYLGDVGMSTWSPANAIHRQITNPDGTFDYPVPVGIYYLLPFVRPAYVFPILTPFLILGFPSLRRVIRPHAVLLAGWLALMVAFFAGYTWENPRFPLSYLVPLAVLAGLGAGEAVRRRPLPRAVAAVCAAGLAGSLLWSVRDASAFVAQKDGDLEVTRWCRAHVPNDARLLAFGLTETLRHYTSLDVAELTDASPETLAAWLTDGRPEFLLVDQANIDTQWSGRTPQTNFAWLHSHADLTEIGRAGAYTLWRVGSPPARSGGAS